MGGGDLFELLVALAVIVFGLLGAGNKKKEQEGRQRRQARQRRQDGEASARPGPGTRRPVPAGHRDELLSEIDRILRGQLPEARPVPPPAAPEPAEAVSLEVDAEARHDQFHDKYVRPLKPTPVTPAIGQTAPPVARARRIPLRQAVIWREILGPPKGLL